MTILTPEQVLERLSVRNGMQHFEYFVGRQRVFTRLAGVLSQEQSSPGWIHGPRRLGKSSLAQDLAAQARERGSATVYVDASQVPAADFAALLERVLERSPYKLSPTGAETAQKRFTALAARSAQQPILVVFDEFDHIAIHLGTDEQAFLRQLKEENPRFGYLFITRLSPALLVEEISQERSRLLGICNPERLSGLERREVHDLFKRISKDLGRPELERWHELVWKVVGGYSTAVMILAHALAAEALHQSLDEERGRELLEEKKREVQEHLTGLWRDLQPGTRALLLQNEAPRPHEPNLIELKQDGFFETALGVLRPTWLIEVGERLGRIPPEPTSSTGEKRMSRVERLHQFILGLNENVKRLGYPAVFAPTDEALRYFWLTRSVTSEEQLKSAVDHLYKVLCEGARSSSGTKEWRMPGVLLDIYRGSDGYEELITLRNFYSHDPNVRDAVDTPSSRYQNQGSVFRRHCGEENPRRPDQWNQIRDGLVNELMKVLTRMEEQSLQLPRVTK
jgi:hypothetical protein